MKCTRLVWLPLLCLAMGASAFAAETDGTIVSRSILTAPAKPATPLLNYSLEKIVYWSDGLRVVALVFHPVEVEGRRIPAIIFNRGGYLTREPDLKQLPRFERYARAGFVVVAPSYRGSDGGEGKDEVGGADFDDVMNLLPLMTNLGFIDTGHLFMMGESRGGFMTLEAIRAGFPLRAAATVGAATDFGRLLAADPRTYNQMIPIVWPDFARDRDAILERRSAVRWAGELHTPLLLMHGGADGSVDPQQAIELGRLLQAAGAVYELHVFAEGKHTLDDFAAERDRETVEWFSRFMERGK
ncbi:MAG: prolyl oligopeptidase family serine peptidase [Acidobacteriota bacterium]